MGMNCRTCTESILLAANSVARDVNKLGIPAACSSLLYSPLYIADNTSALSRANNDTHRNYTDCQTFRFAELQ